MMPRRRSASRSTPRAEKAVAPVRTDVRFLLGRQARVLRSIDPTMTVLDYLRDVEHLIGTKEGCNEGDCGACTVVRVRLEGEKLRYQAINACIHLVGMLEGCQLLTVEHLADPDGALHPVQQAVADNHGSQCGFCTPGFVMSLFALTREAVEYPRDQRIDDTLAGNLCRCTGYAPIVRAAKRVCDEAPVDDHIADAERETRTLLRALIDDRQISINHDGRRFYAPATIADLDRVMAMEPGATIVAGATDVGIWLTKAMRRLPAVVYIGRIAALQQVERHRDKLVIGAGASYVDATSEITRSFKDFGELVRRLGSVQIRNAGTMGGNIANGSPVGDMPPALIALDATLWLRRDGKSRTLPVEDFFIDYGEQDLRPGEFIERIEIPLPRKRPVFRAYKVSKRFDQDISAVVAAVALVLSGGRVAAARIAFGGMAAIPKRAEAAEQAMIGRRWEEATIQDAIEAVAEDFTPIDDWRASAAYRSRLAENLLNAVFRGYRRSWHQGAADRRQRPWLRPQNGSAAALRKRCAMTAPPAMSPAKRPILMISLHRPVCCMSISAAARRPKGGFTKPT